MPNIDQLAENQPVNLTLLDTMVVDYLYHEGILEENLNKENAEAFGQYRDKMDSLKKIRDFMLSGQIEESMELVMQIQPTLLNDPKLRFKIEKQKFVEIVRRGENPQKALEFAQKYLAPQSLTAFPEAYAEFKNCLLLLIYKENSLSELSGEWSLSNREELAATLHAQLLAALGVNQTIFSYLFRYLATIHNLFHIINGIPSPFFVEMDQLVLPERLPPPPSKNLTLALNIADVQLLAQTVSIPQGEATNALRNANGSINDALKNELTRIQMNHDLLIELCLDYCDHRGIIGQGKLHFTRKGKKFSLQEPSGGGDEPSSSEKIARLKTVREAFTQNNGKIREAVETVLSLDPLFPEQHPQLYFQLKQSAFFEAIKVGDLNQAIQISSDVLNPMATKFPEFAPALRNTLIFLAFPPGAPLPLGVEPTINPPSLAAPLYTLLGQKLKLVEPKLLKMIKYLLTGHSEWFKQNKIPDRFEGLFKIDLLGEPDGHFRERRNSGNGEGNEAGNEAGNRENEDEEMEGVDEYAIQTLAEMMNLTREQAVRLLNDHGGDLNEVLQTLLA